MNDPSRQPPGGPEVTGGAPPARELPVVPAWRWWLGLGVACGIGGFLTILAYREQLPAIFQQVPQFDKVVHFTLGGFIAFFLDGALKRRAVRIGRFALPLAWLATLVPAGIEEYLQRYSMYRTSSIWDFLADLLGVSAFIYLSRRVAR